MTIATIKKEIKDLKNALNTNLDEKFKVKLREQLSKSEKTLAEMESAKTPTAKKTATKKANVVAKKSTSVLQKVKQANKKAEPKKGTPAKKSTAKQPSALQKIKNQVKLNKNLSGYKKSGIDLLRDGNRPALPAGKRISKDGNVYYENRLNRVDVRQPSKKVAKPNKLEEGGMMAKGGKTLFDILYSKKKPNTINYGSMKQNIAEGIYKSKQIDNTINSLTGIYDIAFDVLDVSENDVITNPTKQKQFAEFMKDNDADDIMTLLAEKPKYDTIIDGMFNMLDGMGYGVLNNYFALRGYYGSDTYHEYKNYYNENPKMYLNPSIIKPEMISYEDGMMAKGGKMTKLLEKLQNTNTISESEILLIKGRLNKGNLDSETQEVVDFINENYLNITPEQTKKGYDFLMSAYKTPTGKEKSNTPFADREKSALDTFEEFQFVGFTNVGRGSFDNYLPLYAVIGKMGSFEYYYDGKINIYAEKGGMMAKGGRLKSAIMRDRAYKSNEPHEQAYTRKTRPKNPKYNYGFFEDGGSTEMHRAYAMGGVLQHGLESGDFIVSHDEGKMVVMNGGNKYEVNIHSGSRTKID